VGTNATAQKKTPPAGSPRARRIRRTNAVARLPARRLAGRPGGPRNTSVNKNSKRPPAEFVFFWAAVFAHVASRARLRAGKLREKPRVKKRLIHGKRAPRFQPEVFEATLSCLTAVFQQMSPDEPEFAGKPQHPTVPILIILQRCFVGGSVELFSKTTFDCPAQTRGGLRRRGRTTPQTTTTPSSPAIANATCVRRSGLPSCRVPGADEESSPGSRALATF